MNTVSTRRGTARNATEDNCAVGHNSDVFRYKRSRNEYAEKTSKAAHSDMKPQNTVSLSQALDNFDDAGASHSRHCMKEEIFKC